MLSKNAFKNYIEISDINKGKVLPLELSNEGKSLRMRLDNKQLLAKFNEDKVDMYYLDRFDNIITDKLGESLDVKSLEPVFNKVMGETITKYQYSLENLLESIKRAD